MLQSQNMGVLPKPLMQALGQQAGSTHTAGASEDPAGALERTVSRNSLLGRLKATQAEEMSPLVPMSPRASKQQQPGAAGVKVWEEAQAGDGRPLRKLQFVARTPKNSVFGAL